MEATLLDDLRARADELGFKWVGVCGPTPSRRGANAYRSWIDAGMHGEMGYMARPDRVARALDPDLSLAGVRTMLVVGSPYPGVGPDPNIGLDPSRGLIARYARGDDYHGVIEARLASLADWLAHRLAGRAADLAAGRDADQHVDRIVDGAEDLVAGSAAEPVARRLEHCSMVDYRPLLERDAAHRAGLGFVGRNTMLIHRRHGSWSFLGALLLNVDRAALGGAVQADGSGTSFAARDMHALGPQANRHNPCGRCTRCLDACPTQAFPTEYVLDARRCISYLTIELKGPIPSELRPLIGNRVFGCDVCNEVCPYNRQFSSQTREATFAARADLMAPDLVELLALDDAAFVNRFQGTPIERTKRRGLLRNVCVALGNWRNAAPIPAISQALVDAEPLIRGHAAWALGQIATRDCGRVLASAQANESDAWAIEEITQALKQIR